MRRIAEHDRRPEPADPATFELPATMQRLLGRDDGLPVRLYRVAFGEEASTHWHRHDGIQVLFGLEGRCVVEGRGGTRLPLDPGDVVIVDPEEEHRHGAAPGSTGVHLALNLGETTTWLGAD